MVGFVATLTFTRGMARVVRRVQKIPIKVQNVKKETISSGKRTIVFGDNKVKTVHHDKVASTTFEELGLRKDVVNGLKDLNINFPTVIQKLAIPLVNEKKNLFCAAQTGSGKTFVYAAPIISNLKNEVDDGFINRLSRPRALVVAPSRELALQILKVFKDLSHHAPIRSLGLIGQRNRKWQIEYLRGIVDVVVGTPDTLLKYHRKGRLVLSDLRYLVLDEGDTMWDENFRKTTSEIFNMCGIYKDTLLSQGNSIQCILAAATLPQKGVISGLKNYLNTIEVVQSNLHKVLPHVKHTFEKTKQTEKFDMLHVVVKDILEKPSRQCVIFANTTKSTNYVSAMLAKNSIEHSKIHGNMNPQVRLREFEKFSNQETRILTCTDVASRGLDTSNVVLVINFDCPFNVSDYLHRSGRTGRAREQYPGEGEVITFITQNKEVTFARKIQTAAEKNESIDEIKAKKNSSKLKYQKEVDKFYSKIK